MFLRYVNIVTDLSVEFINLFNIFYFDLLLIYLIWASFEIQVFFARRKHLTKKI